MNHKNIDNIIELSNELRWQIGDDFHDNLTESIYADAADIVKDSVQVDNTEKRFRLDAKIDKNQVLRLRVSVLDIEKSEIFYCSQRVLSLF